MLSGESRSSSLGQHGHNPGFEPSDNPKSLFERFAQIARAGERAAVTLELLSQRIDLRHGRVISTLENETHLLGHSSGSTMPIPPGGKDPANSRSVTTEVPPPIEGLLNNQKSANYQRQSSPQIPPNSSPELPHTIETTIRIDQLWDTCRIVNTEPKDAGPDFDCSLQLMITIGHWTTIAAYEFRHGHGFRYFFYGDQVGQPFVIELPRETIKEMAHEDFRRNWPTYCHQFIEKKVCY